MSYMHYGELNPRIRRLDPREVIVKNRLQATPTQATDGVYIGSFNGIDAAIKPLYKERGEAQILRDDPNFRLHNGKAEANALYILQGVPCVPTLYGVVTRPIVNGEGAIVEQFAKGKTFYDAMSTSTGVNVYKALGSQLAGNLVGALDRGLVVRDFKPGEVFVDVKQDGIEVLRVDYGMAKDIGEARRYDFDEIMQCSLEFIPRVKQNQFPNLFDSHDGYLASRASEIRREIQSQADKFRTEGLRTLPHLLSSYANGDFYQDSPETFRQFVTLWGAAMEESGRFSIERENVRKTAQLKARVQPTVQKPKETDLEEEMWKLSDRARDNPQEAYSIIEKINDLRETIHELDGIFYNDGIARAAFLDARVKAKRATGQSCYLDAGVAFNILRRFEDDEGIAHEMSEAYADSIIKEEKDPNEGAMLKRYFDDARKSN